jgi:hypothetical protein
MPNWNRLFKLSTRLTRFAVVILLIGIAAAQFARAGDPAPAAWTGTLSEASGKPVAQAEVELREANSGKRRQAVTDARGGFAFADLAAGEYSLSVRWQGRTVKAAAPLKISAGQALDTGLQLGAGGVELVAHRVAAETAKQATGGEVLSSQQVADLPLNGRDFSQLLLLAAGTMTDTNGAANFTQQFAVNGQRGTTGVFAMDGIDTTDPEMGGSTFSNFNVDAIQEIKASSGVMPAEIGHGAAGFTNIVTKSGADQLHGSVFEFARNSAFDARNFFDRRNIANPERIPYFVRNEFGFTNGGPVVLPGVYDGRHRTFYFGQYQGFRQILGTTQVLSVPTAEERQGLDTTAFAGDTLRVPVNPQMAAVLADYPLPNDPIGAYGVRTFATSAKVLTDTDQFSLRIDHRISDQAAFFARFNFANVTGPLTNPDQTAINPSYAIRFLDHQRNAGMTYTRTSSPNFIWESSLGFIRATPFFPSINSTQPALEFGDGLYEPINSADGSVIGAFGNLLQARQNFTVVHGTHTLKWGWEIRQNRDATVFGTNPNGLYTFGGGPAYSPVEIPSASGRHNIQVGDLLPDSLTGLLTATPFSYTISLASPEAATGDRFNEASLHRQAYNFYIQDDWKAAPRVHVSYGLRYEFDTRFSEPKDRTSGPVFVGPDGQPVRSWDPGVSQQLLVRIEPPYQNDWRGWGPRLAIELRESEHTVWHAGAAITTRLPNLFQEDFSTGAAPFMVQPTLSAKPGVSVPFENAVTHFNLPIPYTPLGQPVFPTSRTTDVLPNTAMNVQRYETDLAAATPGHQLQPLSIYGMMPDFADGYIQSYTAGVDHEWGDVKFSAAYVGTMGVRLPSIVYPNGYTGADANFAPFTSFDSAGDVLGGFGPEALMSSRSHSTYHALQAGVEKTSPRLGLEFQASYTLSKSLDDTSATLGGFLGSSGTLLQASPQNPSNPGAEKGPSTFDTTHVFTISLIEALPFDQITALRPLGRKLTTGWQFLNITTLTSGSPFTVFSGIQQTGVGSTGADRPDQIAQPDFSTRRTVREDYFGRGADNPSFFPIPINLPGGSGPNAGKFGTLGRDTFRGPDFHDLDMSLIKDTPLGKRGNSEAATLEFRAEFFNVFNLVNFGLPSNVVLGSGFGLINKTAGPSRQIQFSLKLNY